MRPSLDFQADEIIAAGAGLADAMSEHFEDVPRAVCAMAACMLIAQLIVDDQDEATDGARLYIVVEEILKCVHALRQVTSDGSTVQ